MYVCALLQCFPDRAVGKEIKLLLVKCSNHTSGCPWQGKLQDLEVDYMTNPLTMVAPAIPPDMILYIFRSMSASLNLSSVLMKVVEN